MKGWTDTDLERLKRYAQPRGRGRSGTLIRDLTAEFPGRSELAIRNKLLRLRREMGIEKDARRTGRPTAAASEDNWQSRDAAATARLGEAIERLLGRAG
jgi:hypothetical protein